MSNIIVSKCFHCQIVGHKYSEICAAVDRNDIFIELQENWADVAIATVFPSKLLFKISTPSVQMEGIRQQDIVVQSTGDL